MAQGQRLLMRISQYRRLRYYFYTAILFGCCFGVEESLATSSSSSGHSMSSTHTESMYDFPGVMETTYSQIGDINIGQVFFGTDDSETFPAGACSEDITRFQHALELPATIAFAINLINQDPNLLPNVTMGFILRLSCYSIGVTIGTFLDFLPLNKKHSSDSNISCYHSGCEIPEINKHSHDVIGMMGHSLSSIALITSPMSALARLPMIGATEGADELSNKDAHPYFFRVRPSIVYDTMAMLKFISSNGWSYISVLYLENSYGQAAFDNVKRLSGQYGICIATSHGLVHSTNYDDVVKDLQAHPRARAVILLVYVKEYTRLLQAVENQNAVGQFIWLGSQALLYYSDVVRSNKTTVNPAQGTFVFSIYRKYVPEYREYLRKQNLKNSKHPWLERIWEYLFDCSFALGNCNNETSVLESPKLQTHRSYSLWIDAVLTFAHAAHDLLADKCPGARGQEARACITGEMLRAYLKNTSFAGFNGRIKFDENQEVRGKCAVSQFQYSSSEQALELGANNLTGTKDLSLKQVALYDTLTGSLEYTDPIYWSHLDTLERIVPWTEWTGSERSPPIHVPESVCSGPCSVGEYKIEREVPCCWECRKCRDNELLVDGNTSCQACPEFTWPDPASGFTTCIDIPLTYSKPEDTIPMVLTSLTSVALAVYSFTFVAYLVYRDKRVIKASSKELSAIQLLAIVLGYLDVLLFQLKPTLLLCSAIYSLLCVSFVLLYAPLLVKTVRIVRIFQSGKTNNQQLRFISSRSQLLISGALVSVQVRKG